MRAPDAARPVVRRLLHPVALSLIAAHLTLLALAWWTLQHVVPDTVNLHLFGHDRLVSEVHRRIINRTVEISVLLPSVLLVEYLWTGWKESSVRQLLVERPASGWSDTVCYLLQMIPAWTLLSAVMSLGVVYVSGEWLRCRLIEATGIDITLAGQPLLLQTAILFAVYTLFDYWSHRLDHWGMFWPLHRFHHSAETFCVVTAARVHPAMFTAVVGAVLPGLLLGSDAAAMANMALVIIIIRLVIHSRIQSGFGWLGRWVVQSPLHHRLHHSLDERPTNFGLLPVWDRLFGTWRDIPERTWAIGVEAPYRHGLWIGPDIWRDYREFGAALARFAMPRAGRREPDVQAPLPQGEL